RVGVDCAARRGGSFRCVVLQRIVAGGGYRASILGVQAGCVAGDRGVREADSRGASVSLNTGGVICEQTAFDIDVGGVGREYAVPGRGAVVAGEDAVLNAYLRRARAA